MSSLGSKLTRLAPLLFIVLLISCETETAKDSGRIKTDASAMAELGRINQNLSRGQYVLQSDIDSLNQIREKYPRAEPARQTLIAALVKREDWQSAADVITRIPPAERTENESLSLAKIYLNIGRFEDAVGIVEPLLAKSPGEVELISIIGSAWFYLGKYDEAAAQLDEVRDQLISGKRADEVAVRGMIYFYRRDNARALEMLEKSVELKPDNIFAFNGLARVWASNGDNQKADEYLKKVQSLFEKMTAESQRRIRFVEAAKKLDEAYKAKRYEEVISLGQSLLVDADDANKLALYQFLASSYQALGKTKEYQSAMAEAERLKSANKPK